MAAVFDGKTKVGRAVADPGIDDMLPNPGSLVFGAITTPAAVAGTIGAHSMLIHGDRWQQIDGNFTELLTGNLVSTVTGNQTHSVTGGQTITVGQDHTETIMGNTLQTMIGPQIVSNMDVRNETRAITHLHTHGDNFFQYGPDNQFHYCETNMGAWIFLFEAEAEHSEVAHHHLEGKVVHNYFAAFDTSTCAVRMQNQAVNEQVTCSKGYVDLIKNHVRALETKVGVLQAKGVACAPMAGVDPNPTPMV